MNKRQSVVRKVLFAVSGIFAIFAIIVATHSTLDKAKTVEEAVLQEIKTTTLKASDGIHEFFRERSRVVTSLKGNPFVNGWFEGYQDRGSAIDNDPAYQQIVTLFQNESAHDPMIKSVFYAPAATHEYFDINGRYNDDNYFTSKRPWWGEALKKDRLFITNPEIDANDGSIVTSIKTTVYGTAGQLLGVMGIDILASEIKSGLIDTMSYNGEGHGFLFTSQGQIISFPDPQSKIDMSKLPVLGEVDGIFENVGGFSQLFADSKNNTQLVTEVNFNGEQHLAFVSQIKDDTQALDWRVGIMVPMHVIQDPINDTIVYSIILVLLAIAITSAVIVLVVQRILTKPLLQVVSAMNAMARGSGDLTKRINIDTNDELGQLSRSFNAFVEHIQSIIGQCNSTTDKVMTESDQVTGLVRDFGANVHEQKGYIEQIATAATQMSQTIHGISDNAQSSLEYTSRATQESAEGQSLAVNATELMRDLSTEVTQATDVVTELHKNSESISEVLAVIRGIAEQTNLLALNAAIEAARAGEQGRGFAVVADEVRTLASRTAESTQDIEAIIDKLQSTAATAVAAMNTGKSKTQQGVDVIAQVNDKLNHITEAIKLIEQQSVEAASTIQEQATASGEITKQTVAVNDLADITVSQTQEMASKSKTQKDVTEELTQMISQFKVA